MSKLMTSLVLSAFVSFQSQPLYAQLPPVDVEMQQERTHKGCLSSTSAQSKVKQRQVMVAGKHWRKMAWNAREH